MLVVLATSILERLIRTLIVSGTGSLPFVQLSHFDSSRDYCLIQNGRSGSGLHSVTLELWISYSCLTALLKVWCLWQPFPSWGDLAVFAARKGRGISL